MYILVAFVDIVFASANEAGNFNAEITPVQIKTRKGVEHFTADEHPRPKTTIESLSKLASVFIKETGTVTAG